MNKIQEAHHPIFSCHILSKPRSEAVNLRRIVVVGFHQKLPVCFTDFFWFLRSNEVSHSTSCPQLVIARDTVVTSSLDVPCSKVSCSAVYVNVCEKLVPDGVTQFEIAGWGFLICRSDHLIHPMGATATKARDKNRLSYVPAREDQIRKSSLKKLQITLLTQRSGLPTTNYELLGRNRQ